MRIECDRCDEVLSEPGALVFSPPEVNGRCTKFHLCERCFRGFADWLSDPRIESPESEKEKNDG